MWVYACGCVRTCAGMPVHSCTKNHCHRFLTFFLFHSVSLSFSISLASGARAVYLSQFGSLSLFCAHLREPALFLSPAFSLAHALARKHFLARVRAHVLFHSLSLLHTPFPLSAFHWHTHMTHTHSLGFSAALSLACALSHTRTHTHIHTHIHIHTLSLSRSCSLFLCLCLYLSCARALSLSRPL